MATHKSGGAGATHTADSGTHKGHAKGKADEHIKADEGETPASEAFENFVEAAKKGAKDAAEAAQRTIPALKHGVSKGTYVCCYYLAFAAVYSACLAMELVPEDSPIRHGLRDGAEAAHEAHAAKKHAAHSHHSHEHKTQPANA